MCQFCSVTCRHFPAAPENAESGRTLLLSRSSSAQRAHANSDVCRVFRFSPLCNHTRGFLDGVLRAEGNLLHLRHIGGARRIGRCGLSGWARGLLRFGRVNSGLGGSFQKTTERRPQFRANFDSQVRKNFFMVGNYDSVFPILLPGVQVKTDRVKATIIGSPNLKESCR